MTTTKSDEEFVSMRIKRGVLRRFRMLTASYTQDANGEFLGMSEVMQNVADKALEEKGLKYTETEAA